MSLIQVPQSFKIKDNAYAVLWDVKDSEKVNNFFMKAREGPNYHSNLWISFLKERSKGHKVTLDGIEPLDYAEADDMVTYNGLARFCQLIMVTSALKPTHMGIGTNGSTALATQTTLLAEVTSAAFATVPNYAIPNSTTLEMVINWPTSIATNTYREISVRDQQAVGGSRMFSRNVLTTPFAHTQNVTTFTTSVVIEFIPIVS